MKTKTIISLFYAFFGVAFVYGSILAFTTNQSFIGVLFVLASIFIVIALVNHITRCKHDKNHC